MSDIRTDPQARAPGTLPLSPTLWVAVAAFLFGLTLLGFLVADVFDAAAGPAPVISGLDAAKAPLPDLLFPLAGVAPEGLVDTFQAPRAGHVHAAIDLSAPRGTPIVAVRDGTIVALGHGGLGGRSIHLLDHGGRWVYYYAHLDAFAKGLAEGSPVARGAVLGFVGTSGNAPPGAPHLHFAVAWLPRGEPWWRARAIDPYPLLAGGVSPR